MHNAVIITAQMVLNVTMLLENVNALKGGQELLVKLVRI